MELDSLLAAHNNRLVATTATLIATRTPA